MKMITPDINPTFFYGPIVSYRFMGDVSKDKGRYRIRFTLFFKSGDKYTTQKSGYKTEAEARRAKEVLISELEKGEYIPFSYTVKEFFDYWLYYHMIEEKGIRYNSFQTSRNILYNYLLPGFGADTKLEALTHSIIEDTVKGIRYPSVKDQSIKLIRQLFAYAQSSRFLSINPSVLALRNLSKDVPKPKKREVELYTVAEIRNMLFTCKQCFPEMYMPLLLAVTTGIRISETIAIKYSDIDFKTLALYISRQLGRDIRVEGDHGITTRELEVKTDNSIRCIPLAKWVADEIAVKRAWYEHQKKWVPSFKDLDYICCKCDGTPYNRKSFISPFHALTRMCGLKEIHWHDLRHMYASVLEHNEINMKAVSEYLGHSSPDFTKEVYVTQAEPIYDCTILTEIWEFVKPVSMKAEQDTLGIPFTEEDYKVFFCDKKSR